MDEKQTKALSRLLKRLNAVRQTLRSDERGLLDAMMSDSFPEAEGHAFKPAARPAIQVEGEGHMLKKGASRPAAKPEVEGHVMKPAAKPAAKPEVEGHVMKPAAKPAAKPEVEGHVMKPAAKPAAKPKAKP